MHAGLVMQWDWALNGLCLLPTFPGMSVRQVLRHYAVQVAAAVCERLCN